MGELLLHLVKHLGLNLITTCHEQHPPFMRVRVIVVHREGRDQNKQFPLEEEMGQCASCINCNPLLLPCSPEDLSRIRNIALIGNAFHLYCFYHFSKSRTIGRRACCLINMQCCETAACCETPKRLIAISSGFRRSSARRKEATAIVSPARCLWFIFTTQLDPHLSRNFPSCCTSLFPTSLSLAIYELLSVFPCTSLLH